MEPNWDEWLLQQDRKIKSAQGQEVKAELLKLNIKKIPREKISGVANLARRLNLSNLILRLLTPLMHAPSHQRINVSDIERALYALALARIGSHKESSEYLEKLENTQKDILLLKASAWISQWNYKNAQKIYKFLLVHSKLDLYEDKIVKINLASCMISQSKFRNAISILEEFENLKDSNRLLYANSLELLAQAYFGIGDLRMAEHIVNMSITKLEGGDEDYSLFAKKWLSIIRSTGQNKISDNWEHVRTLAIQQLDYETMRDLDLFQACLTKDRALFFKVYFGTPFFSYRKRALKRFGNLEKIPKDFIVYPGEKLPYPGLLNLESGRFSDQQHKHNVSFSILHIKLLRELARDFYRPVSMGALFAALYPDERFDIFTSPHRLYQLVRNLRKHLNQFQGSPRIVMKRGAFLMSFESTQIKVNLNYRPVKRSDPMNSQLQAWVQSRGALPFNRKELEIHFKISKTRSLQLLKEGLSNKWFRKEGIGNRAWYHAQPKVLREK